MAKHSIARKGDIKAGGTLYAVDGGRVKQWRIIRHEKSAWNRRQCFFEVESKNLEKDFSGCNTQTVHSMGDMGVPGFAYDNRPPQVFTNRRAAEYWCKKWDGVNPNFLNDDYGSSYNDMYDYDSDFQMGRDHYFDVVDFEE